MEEFTLITPDKISLSGRVDEAKGKEVGVVVIVHGLAEHYGRYDYVVERLNDSGYKTYRFDHRGHGRSGGEAGYYSNRLEMIEDVDMVVDKALSENTTVPVFLLGHSMGGYAVANYGTTYPGKVKGIVMSGGWTRDNAKLAIIPEGIDPHSRIPNSLGDGVCSDEKVIEAYINDPLVHKDWTYGLMYAIHAGHEYLKLNADKFTDPVLILHGADDGLVDPQDSIDFFNEIGSTDKGLRIYEKLYHEILNEPEHNIIMDQIIQWLNKHL